MDPSRLVSARDRASEFHSTKNPGLSRGRGFCGFVSGSGFIDRRQPGRVPVQEPGPGQEPGLVQEPAREPGPSVPVREPRPAER